MSSPGSYHLASFAANAEAEIRRLNAQVDLFWPAEGEALVRLGLRDGMDVLDCGCGPGRLIERMRGRLPGLRCTGVEIDSLLVEAGRKHLAASGLPGISIHQGSAENPGLPAASFDFIVMRLVLEHVPDPVAALHSLASLLRPGGRLAVISNDFDFHLRTSPSVPELEALYAAYRASRRRDGGDPCIGRRVPHLLTAAGLTLVGAEVEVAHNGLLGDGPFLKAEGAGIPAQLVQSGFLPAATLDAMTRAWRAMLNTPGHSIVRPLWIAVGERSACNGLGKGDTATGLRSENPKSQDQATHESASNDLAGGKRETPASTADSGPLPRLLALMRDTLERPGIGPDDSLAALAIDSIAAMLLQERIKQLTAVELPVVRFFDDITVASLAARLGSGLGHPPPPPTPPSPRAIPSNVEEGEI